MNKLLIVLIETVLPLLIKFAAERLASWIRKDEKTIMTEEQKIERVNKITKKANDQLVDLNKKIRQAKVAKVGTMPDKPLTSSHKHHVER